jgi:predicted nuclease of predicted toxin-antitoxin system
VKLKLDENLGRAAAELFRRAGHDVETVRSEGLSGSADEDVIAACRREQRGLVTLDRDFSSPLVFRPSTYPGIMVLHLTAKPSHDDLLLVCRTLVRALERESVAGKLWSVERGRIREFREVEPEETADEP